MPISVARSIVETDALPEVMQLLPARQQSRHGSISHRGPGTEDHNAKKAQVIAVKISEGGTGSTVNGLDGYSWALNDIIADDRQNLCDQPALQNRLPPRVE
ncbi:Uu.00g065110.m01.CDS01 [Anthostomella pinea]|uniref:Uu.00g065110.m01.CDS01 n=1 Tax=Anthostomella pinea TaxID=933095 RepID=A0AAI8VN39_9PEZI|nr:Uu.00g065110.m01.CDS01 [Anthostomella pinea]